MSVNYTLLAADMARITLGVFEFRFRQVLSALQRKTPASRRQEILAMTEKIRKELNGPRRTAVLEELMDDLEGAVDRLTR